MDKKFTREEIKKAWGQDSLTFEEFIDELDPPISDDCPVMYDSSNRGYEQIEWFGDIPDCAVNVRALIDEKRLMTILQFLLDEETTEKIIKLIDEYKAEGINDE